MRQFKTWFVSWLGVVVTLIFANLAALNLHLWAHQPRSNTIYVDAVRGDDANPGTHERPFRTLQAAINTINGSGPGEFTVRNVAAK